MFQFEEKKLLNYIDDYVLEILEEEKCFVAGGCITSLFTRREINDVDIYFRSKESLINALSQITENGCHVIAHTDKATMFIINNSENSYQFIHFKYFEKAEDIFDTFDFTVCMGAYNFEKEEFILHPSFLAHNSQRLLKVNEKTSYPIVTALRVQKYIDKGYTISKPEFIKIMLVINQLNINTYKELKEQMGGMYGVNYDNIFADIVDDDKFDINIAIEKLSDLVLDDDYFKVPISNEEDKSEYEKVIAFINSSYVDGNYGIYKQILKNYNCFGGDSSKVKYVIVKGINILAILDEDEIDVKEERLSQGDGVVEVYKNVQLNNDGTLCSFYKNTFKYELLKEIVAKDKRGLFFSNSIEDCNNNNTYSHNKDRVIIKCAVSINNMVGEFQFSTCVPLEIVSKELTKDIEVIEKEIEDDEDDWI